MLIHLITTVLSTLLMTLSLLFSFRLLYCISLDNEYSPSIKAIKNAPSFKSGENPYALFPQSLLNILLQLFVINFLISLIFDISYSIPLYIIITLSIPIILSDMKFMKFPAYLPRLFLIAFITHKLISIMYTTEYTLPYYLQLTKHQVTMGVLVTSFCLFSLFIMSKFGKAVIGNGDLLIISYLSFFFNYDAFMLFIWIILLITFYIYADIYYKGNYKTFTEYIKSMKTNQIPYTPVLIIAFIITYLISVALNII